MVLTKNKPVILTTIDWFDPGFKAGGPVTSLRNLITHLSNDFHFKVITSDREYMSDEPYEGITANQWIERGSYEIMYLSAHKANTMGIRSVIQATEFDIAYINGIYSKVFSIAPLSVVKNKPVIVASRGMLSPNAIAIKPLKKRLFLAMARVTGLYSGVTFHATNELEKDHVLSVFPKVNVEVVPNLPPPIQNRTTEVLCKHSGTLKLLFAGRIAREKNTLQAIRALKNIQEHVRLTIVGAVYDEEYLELCMQEVQKLPVNANIVFKDSVNPYKLVDLYNDAHYLFLPTHGENFGHVILESILTGTPVIISDKTPWNTLADKGSFVCSIDSDDELAKAIKVAGLENQEEYNLRVQQTREYAESYIAESKVIGRTKQLFKDIFVS